MTDVSAGQLTIEGRFETLYAMYERSVRRFISSRLDRAVQHLVDDFSQETWLEAWKSLESLKAADEAAFAWLATIARRVISHHFRRPRSTEIVTDFADSVQARRLPSSPAAGDVAVVRLEARELLAQTPVARTSSVRRQVAALADVAVAA